MKCTQSYCIVVKLPDGRRIMIPCMELIRFYFGSSSGFVSKLISPTPRRADLYNGVEHDSKSNHVLVRLAERISSASAADIARIALDPNAWRAATLIGRSAIEASTTKQVIYPRANFPFTGKTDLQAVGQWLSFGDQPRASFLVFNLRSCSHPFPFHSLQYELPRRRPDGGSAAGQNARSSSAPDSKNQSLVERDASNRLAPKTHRF